METIKDISKNLQSLTNELQNKLLNLDIQELKKNRNNNINYIPKDTIDYAYLIEENEKLKQENETLKKENKEMGKDELNEIIIKLEMYNKDRDFHITTLKQEIETLKKENIQLKESYDEINLKLESIGEVEKSEIGKLYDDIENDNFDLKQENQRLENEIDELNVVIQDLEKTDEEYQSVDELKNQIEELIVENNELDNKNEELEDQLNTKNESDFCYNGSDEFDTYYNNIFQDFTDKKSISREKFESSMKKKIGKLTKTEISNIFFNIDWDTVENNSRFTYYLHKNTKGISGLDWGKNIDLFDKKYILESYLKFASEIETETHNTNFTIYTEYWKFCKEYTNQIALRKNKE